MSSQRPLADDRLERILAYMVASTVALSILAFLAVLIGTAVGAFEERSPSTFWIVVFWIPAIGLPIGFVLLLALLVVNGTRRARASRQGSD